MSFAFPPTGSPRKGQRPGQKRQSFCLALPESTAEQTEKEHVFRLRIAIPLPTSPPERPATLSAAVFPSCAKGPCSRV